MEMETIFAPGLLEGKSALTYGILVNAIAPGTIATSGLDQYDTEKTQESINKLPISRMGRSNEIVMAVSYLL